MSNIETFWRSPFPFAAAVSFHFNKFHSNLDSNGQTDWLVNSDLALVSTDAYVHCVHVALNGQILGFIIESMPTRVFGG